MVLWILRNNAALERLATLLGCEPIDYSGMVCNACGLNTAAQDNGSDCDQAYRSTHSVGEGKWREDDGYAMSALPQRLTLLTAFKKK